MTTATDTRLGVDLYGKAFEPADGAWLNLAWTLDETKLLGVNLSEVLQRLLLEERDGDFPSIRHYAVDDGHGRKRLRTAAEKHFGLELDSTQIFCGAGVTGLLYSLSSLCRKGLLCLGATHVDLPAWIARKGLRVDHFTESRRLDTSDLWLMENPGFFIQEFQEDLPSICRLASDHHAIVVVDESNANYLPPRNSWVKHVLEEKNLIVLRGFSKAYSLGSIRVGVAFCSSDLSHRLEMVMPPLAVSSLSLALASRLWSLGDIAAPIREHISGRKPLMKSMLRSCGVHTLYFDNPALPYIVLPPDQQSLTKLNEMRIRGKLHSTVSLIESQRLFFRLSIPLSEPRWLALQKNLIEIVES
ncbi:aminotransferase class I/II-fold pyridoxal phosphate-dependent enzyme [Dyella choica]|nr:aminotransferase class I/II-fold pyridoxal phosphate-dependent enzyme [Dyella choica]